MEKEKERDYADKFLRTLWITKGARFEAHRRLMARHTYSVFTIAILSIYVIGASLISLMYQDTLQASDIKFINLFTVLTSVFILVVSIYESGRDYVTRAELMLRCGQNITELHSEVDYKKKQGLLELDNFQPYIDRYHNIMREYNENHENIDYKYFVTHHKKEFKGKGFSGFLLRYKCKFEHFIIISLFYYLMLAVPLLATAIYMIIAT